MKNNTYERPDMTEQLVPTQLIDSLAIDYALSVIALQRLSLGADENAAVYKACADNATYFVKLKHDYDVRGAVLQQFLHDTGIEYVVAPVTTRDGQLAKNLNGFTLVVYPFVEGRDGFSQHLTDEQWILLGKTLRHIHACAVPHPLKDQIRRETYSAQWRDAVRDIYAYLDDTLAPDDVAAQLLACMQEKRDVIEHVVRRADELAQTIKKHSTELVLCHGDIHAGNVLIASDGALFIVDWDQPIMAPKERDLMFIGAGVGNVWNNPREEELFYQGYGATVINWDVLAYYRYERIVEDVAVYAQALLFTNAGGQERAIMYSHFMAMFEPNGVVDRALVADKNLRKK